MKNKHVVLLMISVFLISILSVVAMIIPASASPTEIHVPTDYPTIQAAIGNASSGDTIIVSAGTYAGAIVDKNVTIIGGSGGATIITSGVPYKVGSTLYTAFRLDATADGAEIRSFAINCNSTGGFYFAIFSRDADSVTIDSLAVNDAVQGITNYGGSDWQITNNVLNNTEAAGGGGIAIYLGVLPPTYPVCSRNLIQNNTITATATAPDYTCPGIGLGVDMRGKDLNVLTGSEDMSNNQILNNSITAPGALNGVGIEIGVIGLGGNVTKIAALLGKIHDNTVRGNTIEGADMGVYFYTVANLTIQQNEIENCNEGIHIKDGSDGNIINYNNIFGNTIGINMSARAQVYNNTIEGGRTGIWLGPGPYSISTAVKGNTIIDFVKAGIVTRGVKDIFVEGNNISTTLHDEAPNGIDIGTYSGTNGTVRENEISGCSWKDFTGDYETSWSGSGILVIESGDSLEIIGNTVHDCDVGMDIESDSMNITCNEVYDNIYGFVFWNAKPKVNYNDIYSNTQYGVYRTTLGDLTGILDARYNWWGNANGPTHSSNPDGTGDTISDNVDYSPWLGATFATTPRTYHVNPSGAPGAIQEAIDEANPGDTIAVHEGTYYENVVVNKPLTITSASLPIIDGGAAGNCFTISANNVVINGFEIRNGYSGIIGETDGSTFSNNIIHDNLNIPGYSGMGICLWGDNDNNIIIGNIIYNNDRQGIFIGYSDTSKISTGNIITYNTIYNNGLYRYPNGPDASAYGIQLWTADNNVIKYNEIYDHDDWFPYGGTFDFAQGIYLCDSNNNLVAYNNLHNNNYAVGLWHPSRPVVTNYINYNDIWDNTGYGVRTFDGPPAVDARFNWWGHASGPTHSSNPGGTGDRISDNVDYSPWLGFVVGTSPMTWHVNPTGAPGAIQEAINVAASGDTIIVHEGTYYENLVVPKALTIQGVDRDTTIIQAQPVGYGDKAIEIKANDVTISGFTISGYAATQTKPGSTYWGVYAYGSSSSHYSNIVVTDNIFTFLSQSGIQLGYVDGSLIADNIFKRETRLVWYDPPGPTPGSYIDVTRGGSGPALWYCTNVIIDPNVIQTDGVGIFLYSSSDILIEANTISAPDTTSPSDIGIHVQSCTDIDIIGNTILNFTAGPKSGYTYGTSGTGINIYVSKAVNVSHNNLYDNTIGVLVQRLNLTAEPREVYIQHNNIENNTEFGVLNCYTWIGKDKTYTPTNASYLVNATYNWWGHETGPYHATSWEYMGEPYGPHFGLGDNVSDYVLYVPWLPLVHDVAVINVSVSPTTVVAGETVTIDVTVENQGSDYETFAVKVYYDDTPIGSQNVINLFPSWNTTLTFYWDTPLELPRGNYTIKAYATPVVNETDIEDNTLIDGIVEILWHDVTVTNVVTDRTWVYQGHTVNINVTVLNKGDFPETVTVTLYYNITANQIIGTQIISLQIGESQTLNFTWDTTGVEYCHNYIITAVASITFPDNDPLDNTLADGFVKVRIFGDVNDDGKVNVKDIFAAAKAFGTYPGHERWDPDIDMNKDLKIDVKDLFAIAKRFGESHS